MVNPKPPASLIALSKSISILAEGIFPSRKVFEVKAAGEGAQTAWTPPPKPPFAAPPAPERGSDLAGEMSPLVGAMQLKGHFSPEEQSGETLSEPTTTASPLPSPAMQCNRLSALRCVLPLSICPSHLPLFLKARGGDVCSNACATLALFLLCLEELGKGRETYLERERIKD